jgi:GNAT superfamily N-acetyltransferase
MAPTEWYRDRFLISTSPELIQPAAVNASLASDALYWAKAMEEGRLMKMLERSLCFGVYELPESTSAIAGITYYPVAFPSLTLSYLGSSPRQIGLARLVTDEVTFAYLTDVYIIPEFQRKGLSTWLMGCVDETLTSWPELKRVYLATDTENNKFYFDKLRMKEVVQGQHGISVLVRKGAGSIYEG